MYVPTEYIDLVNVKLGAETMKEVDYNLSTRVFRTSASFGPRETF